MRLPIATSLMLFVAGLWLPLGLYSAGMGIDAPDCDDFEVAAVSEIAAIGAIEVERGPFDFTGTRLVGCIENRGDGMLHSPWLIYDTTQEHEEVSRGRPRYFTIITGGLAPGETRRFYALALPPQNQQHERTEDIPIAIQRLYTNQPLHEDQEEQKQMFDLAPPIEMTYPMRPLPKNDLHATCSTYPASDHSGMVALRDVQLIEVHGKTRVAGCIVNGLDKTIADGRQSNVSAQYGGTPAPDYEGFRIWGGISHLSLPEALAPGDASVFVSQFDVPDSMARIEITLTEWTLSGDVSDMDVSVTEHSNRAVIER